MSHEVAGGGHPQVWRPRRWRRSKVPCTRPGSRVDHERVKPLGVDGAPARPEPRPPRGGGCGSTDARDRVHRPRGVSDPSGSCRSRSRRRRRLIAYSRLYGRRSFHVVWSVVPAASGAVRGDHGVEASGRRASRGAGTPARAGAATTREREAQRLEPAGAVDRNAERGRRGGERKRRRVAAVPARLAPRRGASRAVHGDHADVEAVDAPGRSGRSPSPSGAAAGRAARRARPRACRPRPRTHDRPGRRRGVADLHRRRPPRRAGDRVATRPQRCQARRRRRPERRAARAPPRPSRSEPQRRGEQLAAAGRRRAMTPAKSAVLTRIVRP